MATARPALEELTNTGPQTATAMLPKSSSRIRASMAKPFLAFTGFSV